MFVGPLNGGYPVGQSEGAGDEPRRGRVQVAAPSRGKIAVDGRSNQRMREGQLVDRHARDLLEKTSRQHLFQHAGGVGDPGDSSHDRK